MKKFSDIIKVSPVDYVLFQLTFTFSVIKNCVEKKLRVHQWRYNQEKRLFWPNDNVQVTLVI